VSGSHDKLGAKHEGGQNVRGSQHNMGSAASCQTCHIPEFARGGVPTKMQWDYSKAGQRGPHGKPLVLKVEHGHPTYLGIKVQFKLGEDVVPDYPWFNGAVTWMNIGETRVPDNAGEWKQYIPTFDQIFLVVRHYAWGMFRGEEHPYQQSVARKHNQLLRLAYLWVKLMINPFIWISGIWLLFFADWDAWPVWQQWGINLQTVAWAHTIGAYMMLIFFIIHVYLTTTGHTPMAHILAMIRGYEDEPAHHKPHATNLPKATAASEKA